MRSARGPAVLALIILAAPTVLTAQQTRNQRITAAQQAYQNFDTGRALDLLRAALNPAEGPADSAWAYGVELLGQILSESGDTAQARVWFRWAFRQAPAARVDSVNFLPDVAAAMRAVRAATQPSAGDVVSRTRWDWAIAAPAGQGRLQVVSPRVTAPITAQVRGATTIVVQSGQTVAIPVGTYTIDAAAEGYLPTQMTREILPGVVTVIDFNLSPVAAGILATSVRATVYRQLIPLTVHRFQNDSTCATGALIGGSGLVLTSYAAIRGADRVSASIGGQRYSDVIRVLASSPGRNLAVLQLPVTRADSLPLAAQVSPGQFVWGLGLANCQTALDARSRVGMTLQPALDLSDSIRNVGDMGPLISSDGAVVGVVAGARSAVPLASVRAVVDSARRQVAAPAAQKLTVAQVALQANHAYGAMAITADVTGVTARVTPLETWQWPEVAWSGALPHTFTGPMGRYQLEVTAPGQAARRLTFTIQAGQAGRFPVTAAQVAGGPGPQVQPGKKKGGFPLPILLIGAGGAGAAAFLLLGGKSPPNPPAQTTGNLIILIP
jgi:hypothetical protein